MTEVKKTLRKLDMRRRNAALSGAIIGGAVGLFFTFDFFVGVLAGVAGSLIFWYLTSIPYWEYRDSVTLKGRER